MQKMKIKLILFSISGCMLLTTGYHLKRCRDQSKNYTKQVNEYTNSFDDDDFLIAAHRGYSSLAVENTNEALTIANNSPYVDYIEIDARLTKDEKLVLSHNDFAVSDSNRLIYISKSNCDSIIDKQLIYLSSSLTPKIHNFFNEENGDILITRSNHLDVKKYKLITLSEGINLCCEKKILLDLKFQDNTQEFISALELEMKNIDTTNIIFQSSDLLSLLYLQNAHPEYECQALISCKADLEYISSFHHLGIRKNLITRKIVQEIYDNKKTISIWTVNDPKEINRVIENIGCQYKNVIYISDYPDVVAKCLHDKEKKLVKDNTTP